MLAAVLTLIGCGKSTADELVPIGAGLRGPRGLEATVYATGLANMSAFAFDARGRLWVTVSGSTRTAPTASTSSRVPARSR